MSYYTGVSKHWAHLIIHVVRLLAEIVDKNKNMVWNIHNHDSLLENKVHNHPT